MTKPARSLEFDTDAFEDLAYWVNHDRKKASRVMRLIQETQTDPFSASANRSRTLRIIGMLVKAH